MRLNRVLIAAAGTAALLVPALPAQAAHESNNKAELSGVGTTGTAVVNYIEGREDNQWTANVRVRGLDAGDYSYVLVAPNGTDAKTVCTFTAKAKGSAGCSDSSFETGGFATAEVRDEDGDVVAEGAFARRGGQRSL